MLYRDAICYERYSRLNTYKGNKPFIYDCSTNLNKTIPHVVSLFKQQVGYLLTTSCNGAKPPHHTCEASAPSVRDLRTSIKGTKTNALPPSFIILGTNDNQIEKIVS